MMPATKEDITLLPGKRLGESPRGAGKQNRIWRFKSLHNALAEVKAGEAEALRATQAPGSFQAKPAS